MVNIISYQIPMVWIMGITDEHVSHIVKVPIKRSVATDNGWLHQVTKNVNPGVLVQSHFTTVWLKIIVLFLILYDIKYIFLII